MDRNFIQSVLHGSLVHLNGLLVIRQHFGYHLGYVSVLSFHHTSDGSTIHEHCLHFRRCDSLMAVWSVDLFPAIFKHLPTPWNLRRWWSGIPGGFLVQLIGIGIIYAEFGAELDWLRTVVRLLAPSRNATGYLKRVLQNQWYWCSLCSKWSDLGRLLKPRVLSI